MRRLFFPLVVGRRRTVIFRRKVYEPLFKGIRERFSMAGEPMLYHQGFAIGRRTCQAHEEDTGLEDSRALVGACSPRDPTRVLHRHIRGGS